MHYICHNPICQNPATTFKETKLLLGFPPSGRVWRGGFRKKPLALFIVVSGLLSVWQIFSCVQAYAFIDDQCAEDPDDVMVGYTNYIYIHLAFAFFNLAFCKVFQGRAVKRILALAGVENPFAGAGMSAVKSDAKEPLVGTWCYGDGKKYTITRAGDLGQLTFTEGTTEVLLQVTDGWQEAAIPDVGTVRLRMGKQADIVESQSKGIGAQDWSAVRNDQRQVRKPSKEKTEVSTSSPSRSGFSAAATVNPIPDKKYTKWSWSKCATTTYDCEWVAVDVKAATVRQGVQNTFLYDLPVLFYALACAGVCALCFVAPIGFSSDCPGIEIVRSNGMGFFAWALLYSITRGFFWSCPCFSWADAVAEVRVSGPPASIPGCLKACVFGPSKKQSDTVQAATVGAPATYS